MKMNREVYDRIVIEKKDLTIKIDALKNFIDKSMVFSQLEDTQKLLLHSQYNAMTTYNDILAIRLLISEVE